MGDVMLNGRRPLEWELPAIEYGRQCERVRDATVVAGLLAGDEVPPKPERPRPVTDLILEFS